MNGMADSAPAKIAIVGVSARLPGAHTLDQFWELLAAGGNAVTPVPKQRWDADVFYDADRTAAGKTYCIDGGFLRDIDQFDAPFFSVSESEAQSMDPQQRLALQEAWKTFEDAGYAVDSLASHRVGVFVGARTGDYHDAILAQPEQLEPSNLMGHDTSILAARISHYLNLKGPSLTVNTACSSMGVAMHLACQSLRSGEISMALVGGVNIMSTAQRFLMHSRSRLLSKRGKCCPFDEQADGIVLGEAVGFVLLKTHTAARADNDRIYGSILATGVNHNGYAEKGIAAPNHAMQVELIGTVLKQAAVAPESIGYVETHGTGTYKGDAIEANALRDAYLAMATSPINCALGSVKANVGHTVTAAVLPGLLKILLSFQQQKIPPLIHFEQANGLLDIQHSGFYFNTQPMTWACSADRPRRAALSAFSYAGTNFHMVLEDEAPEAAAVCPARHSIVTLSAKTPVGLLAQIQQLEQWLSSRKAMVDINQVAYTLAVGRNHFAFREAFVASTAGQCLEALRNRLVQSRQSPDEFGHVASAAGLQSENCRADVGELLAKIAKSAKRDKVELADVQRLATLYQQGADIAWQQLFNAPPGKIALPGYPFADHRYWRNAGGQAGQSATLTAKPGADSELGLALFFSRRDDACQAFLKIRRSLAGVVPSPLIQVKCGDGVFRQLGPCIYQINPSRLEDYRLLLEALGPRIQRLTHIFHLWNFECAALDFVYHGNIDRSLHLVQKSSATGGGSLSLLYQALSLYQLPAPVALLYLYRGGGDGVQPQNRMASGWWQDMAAPDGRVRFRSLCIQGDAADGNAAAAIIQQELERAEPRMTVDRSYVMTDGQRPLAEAAPDGGGQPVGQEPIPIQAQGVYLLSVGADQTGLALAEEWLNECAGRLVLVHAAGLSQAIAAWRARLAQTQAGRLFCLQSAMANGADLKPLLALLGNVGGGGLNGLVHLVGLDDHSNFARNVLEPLLLDEATKNAALDFLLLLSIGTGPANRDTLRFRDGFCELRHRLRLRGKRQGLTLSRHWPLSDAGSLFRGGLSEAFRRQFDVVSVARPAAGNRPATGTPESHQAIEQSFHRMIGEVLKRDANQVDLLAPMESLELDSIRITEVIDRLNNAHAAQLSPSIFYKHSILQDVAKEIATRLAAVRHPEQRTVAPPQSGQASPGALLADLDSGQGPIAVIGLSCRFPKAGSAVEFWRNLLEERDCIVEVPPQRWDWQSCYGDLGQADKTHSKWGGFIDDIDKFDPSFFGISAHEAELMDPQHRVFIQCVWQAIEDAGYNPAGLAGTDTGVFAGVATCDYASLVSAAGAERQAHSPLGLFHSILANRISYLLDLRGPSEPIDTACSSSLVAVHRAVNALRHRQCSLAIVGGVNALLTSSLHVAFSQAGMLSEDGRCKTFDERANGYVRGEGVGVLLLKRLGQAVADGDHVYALIKASAENHGGRAYSLTAPNPQAQAELLLRAYQEARMDPHTIGYIEAHGTGTALGDPIEVDGIKQAFAELTAGWGDSSMEASCGIGSVKTNIGHLEAASGIAGLIKVVLALRHGMLPASLHCHKLNPRIALQGSPFYIVQKTRPWPRLEDGGGRQLPRRAGVSSFGFGGVNAHVVLEEYPGSADMEDTAPALARDPACLAASGGCRYQAAENPQMVVVSARTPERLREVCARLLDFLTAPQTPPAKPIPLISLAYTLQVGREAMAERLGFVVGSVADLVAKLQGYCANPDAMDGIYRGRANNNSEWLRLFNADDELQAAVGRWVERGKHSRLLELWVKGVAVDWRKLYGGGKPPRISLPAYPFELTRYWIGDAAADGRSGAVTTASQAPIASNAAGSRSYRFMEKRWRPSLTPPAVKRNGRVVILKSAETAHLAAGLAGLLPASIVLDGEAIAAASWQDCAGCVDLTGCGREKQQSLQWLTGLQQLIDQRRGQPLTLLCVSKGLESYQNADINLSGALRAGLYRMLQSEYPQLQSRHVDIGPGCADASLIRQVADEFCCDSEATAVCYRHGERFEARLEAVPEWEREQPPFKFPDGQVLWITGGTRGLGYLCAQHFIERYGVRRLVLTGREALPDRGQWPQYIEQAHPLAQKIQALMALEAQGVQLRVLSDALTDGLAMRRNLAAINATLGPIGGLIHCAGMLDQDNPAFIRKPVAAIAQVLAPKAAGLDVLLDSLQDQPLACCVLFSSVSAAIPRLAAGHSDYAMANAYMDYAAAAYKLACPVVSIQWGSWKETGMGEVRNAAYAQTGLLSQTNAEGLRFLDRILAAKAGPVILPAVVDPALWQPEALLRHKPASGVASANPLPLAADSGHVSRTEAALEAMTCEWLAQLFAEQLKMDASRLRPDTAFQEYGMDSILLAQLVRKINHTLQRPLDPSVVYEYPTLQALAARLLQTQAQALAAAFGRPQAAGSPATEVVQNASAAAEDTQSAVSGGTSPADIVVVGMSCRFPGANDLSEYWQLLAAGESVIQPVPAARWQTAGQYHAGLIEPITEFDADFFLIPKADAMAMDPQALLLLEESLRLFCQAGYRREDIKGAATGVYLGARSRHKPEQQTLEQARNPILAVGQNYLAANISQFFDLHGPSLVVDTACSSALVAMHMAVQALGSADIDSALVGGVNLLVDDSVHRVFQQRNLLSPDGAFHLFDQRAAGVVPSEGVGLVLLKTRQQAQRDGDRIYAAIKPLKINNDGRTAGPATPNILRQKAVMQAALAHSGVHPQAVAYIETNGSGSEVTDLLELRAIESVYRPNDKTPCSLGSVKPNIGHPLCAEGMAGFIKLLLMLQHKQWVPFLSAGQPMAHYDLDSSSFAFCRELTPWLQTPRIAALNCFADGGTNAHVIIAGCGDEAASRREALPLPVLKRVKLRQTNPPTASAQGSGLPFSAACPWSIRLDRHHPMMKNHRAYGQEILPGLAYIDLLYQYFYQKGYPHDQLRLCNLAIHHPLTVGNDSYVELAISCAAIQPTVWQVNIEGREWAGTPLPPIAAKRYISVEVHHQPAAVEFSETIDMAAIRRQAVSTVPLSDVYARFRRQQLVHSGFMLADGAVYYHSGACYIDVSLPVEALSDAGGFMLHPTLIDGSGVGSGCLLAELAQDEQRLFLPLFYGEFRCSELFQTQVASRVQTASVRRKQDLIHMDMAFFNAKGEKIAELNDFVYKLVREAGLIKSANQPAQAIDSTPIAKPDPVPPAAADGATAEAFLKSVIAAKLPGELDKLDVELGYYDMGLDSALLLDIVDTLNQKLALRLPPTLLFEYTTIRELAGYLVDNHSALFVVDAAEPASLPVRPPAMAAPQSTPSRVDSAQPKRIEDGDIAIIGLAGRYPGANNPAEFWEALIQGRDCITEVPDDRWDWRSLAGLRSNSGRTLSKWGGFIDDAKCFDAAFFRIPPKEAAAMDPQERLFLEVCWEAMEDAGYCLDNLVPPRGDAKRRDVGVFVGVMHKDYTLIGAEAAARGSTASLSLNCAQIANRVSYCCNFHGPSMAIDTVCSSSLTAVHLAVDSLRKGESRVAFAGGVNLSLHPNKYITYGMLDMHSSDGHCRSFGEGGDGYVSSEGIGAVLLKPLRQALADRDHVYAVIKGSAINYVGKVSGMNVPNPVAQGDMISRCLEQTGIDPRTISYIEAHGTGTSLGDPIEIQGLIRAFRQHTQDKRFCAIGSVKSNIGHAESAAGISALTKVVLQLRHQKLAASLHAHSVNPHLDLENSPFYIQHETADWQTPLIVNNGQETRYPRRAGLSSFGATGTNAHLIVEEFSARTDVGGRLSGADRHPVIIVLSAKNQHRLQAYARKLLEFVDRELAEQHGAPSGGTQFCLRDMAYTLQTGRGAFEQRLAFVADSLEGMAGRLGAYLSGDSGIAGLYLGAVQDKAATKPHLNSVAQIDGWLSAGDWDSIAARWAEGAVIDWNVLYADQQPWRVSLPTYPFAKETYWLDADAGRQPTAATQANVATPIPELTYWQFTRQPAEGAAAVPDAALSRVDKADLLVRQILADQLQKPLETIEARLGYFEMGLSSADLARLTQQIQTLVSERFQVVSLFEQTTVAELSGYLAQTYQAELDSLRAAQMAREPQASRYVIDAFPLGGRRTPTGIEGPALEQLVAGLLRNRLALWVEGDALKVRAYSDGLSAELRRKIEACKDDIATFVGAKKYMPLSRSQRRYWVLSLLQPKKAAYNNPIGLRLQGVVDMDRLKTAFLTLVNRHDIMRSLYPRLDKNPVQVILPPVSELICEVVDLTATPSKSQAQAVQELAVRESQTVINPTLGPNLRIKIIQVAADEAVILFTVHHTVFDGYAYQPFLNEFSSIYSSLLSGEPLALAEALQYQNYILREPAVADDRSQLFWKTHLAAAPAFTALPFDYPRPELNTCNGDTQSIWLDAHTWQAIVDEVKKRQVTVFSFMLAILKIAVFQWSQKDDLVFGTTAQCRDEQGDEAIIGDFTNFLPIRSQIDGTQAFGRFLQNTFETTLSCLQHKHFPFDHIVPLAKTAPANINPVYNILVNQLPPFSELEDSLTRPSVRMSVSNHRVLNGAAMLDLRFEWHEEKGGLRLLCEYATDLFAESTIASLLQRIETCLTRQDYLRDPPIKDLMGCSVQQSSEPQPKIVTDGLHAHNHAASLATVEEMLAAKVRELKPIPPIAKCRHVNFFDLGLCSFDVANLSAELEAVYPQFVVGDIFKYPTIQLLSAKIFEAFHAGSAIKEPVAVAENCSIDFDCFRG
jgi:acyl transferase domain-containing protein/acyl carrier protein/NAD(P)-dependent dehydrogenase (short-subunit alcohol dehydrogenase family)